MKKALLLILFLFFYCKKESSNLIKENVEDYLKSNMNDPKSYEFISIDIDTILYSDFDLDNREDIDMNIASFLLDKAREEKNPLTKKSFEIEANYLSKFDSLYKIHKPNDVYRYKVKIDFRGNNAFGAKVKNSKSFIVDTLYNVAY